MNIINRSLLISLSLLTFASAHAQYNGPLYPFDVTVKNDLSVPLTNMIVILAPDQLGAAPGEYIFNGDWSSLNPGASFKVSEFSVFQPFQFAIIGTYTTPDSSGGVTDHVAVSATQGLASFITNNGFTYDDIFSKIDEPSLYTAIGQFYDGFSTNNTAEETLSAEAVNTFFVNTNYNSLDTFGFDQFVSSSGTYSGNFVGFSTGSIVGSFSAQVTLPTPAPVAFFAFGVNAVGLAIRKRRK